MSHDVDRLLQAMQGPPPPSAPPELPQEPDQAGGHGLVPWALAAAVVLGVGVLSLAPDKPWSTRGANEGAPAEMAAPLGEAASTASPADDAVADADSQVPEAEEVAEEPAVARPEPKKTSAPLAEPEPVEMEPEPAEMEVEKTRPAARAASGGASSSSSSARPQPRDCVDAPVIVSLNVVDGRIVSLTAETDMPTLRCLNLAMLGTPYAQDGVHEETVEP